MGQARESQQARGSLRFCTDTLNAHGPAIRRVVAGSEWLGRSHVMGERETGLRVADAKL